jgi:transglutaminase-like putative cysteine protease
MLLPSRYARPTELLESLARELQIGHHGNPLEAMLALNEAIYRAFDYVPNSTKVDSPIDDALQTRQGVCQDFAHIMIALVRNLGVPCRYVSGYLFHGDTVRPDRSADGASHAWVEAFLPGPGWVALDPTNNLLGSVRHIRVAIGRDYADVPPTRGVYKGGAESEFSVTVTVAPAEAPLPEQLPPATVARTHRSSANPTESFAFDQQQQQQQ